MEPMARIERALTVALTRAARGAPPGLGAAMHHAVFPRGARIRPRLCLAVAQACGETDPDVTDGAAAAIELIHCASLAHDDLPCFDDADTRRGRPSVHAAYGAPRALLAGDALIVLAFQTIALAAAAVPASAAPLTLILARAAGAPAGIAAGQAWECEPDADLALYQRQKTGALFAAATVSGAAAAGAEAERWRTLGEVLGEAYQVADDLRDAVGAEDELGKPVGQDARFGRPSAASAFGLDGALARLHTLAEEATDSIPPCPGQAALRAHILSEITRLVPRQLALAAA